ncbi:Nicotinate-nucleotide--dimethylbenzimidazole phosphoribosyltransferase [Slackia heliotrinireducens]|uniref:Nicotinate-nucleotide--dimethylbenzimidazole phosphoribosyltransferase n=1 Tax=Slackia heliotrinireducens (strain ATCC 29202 / DSM 20476 / NCTC 11029 / RHS 1) TaxID=471855 RepID=C7N888_SLAHD|nr:nicotinate-nucleotide--dimethylbenzimidazole phosphoribosyltransferase [Slackia heliotrinireducens]ACV23123.1 nicotinate-nucleotide--dimethylbenzimidazole phosphoribosyltransferase [Slackia heliotrinireducens DSM 20476]VEH02140.1 Nicotinate-nucleotide--dimethylbenzimidazole phosphoribosyltransferase [Slackia heliotrinireducens]
MTALDFAALNAAIPPFDTESADLAREHWAAVAKPLGSLGVLEDAVVQLAGIMGTPNPEIRDRAVLVFCADNGVVAQGVTQCGQEVSTLVADSVAAGTSSVAVMAKTVRAQVVSVDVGLATPPSNPRVVGCSVAPGTADMTEGPAMTPEQAAAAIDVGIDAAHSMRSRGFDILCAGEMGIGNTTTSSAIASVLLGLDPTVSVGRGAGLDDEGLARKEAAVRRAIQVNAPDPADAFDVLCKVGGFDICAMAGLYIGGALCGMPVVVDGLVSAVAALAASRLCPACTHAMLASHISTEPATVAILEALGLHPPINAGMRLGEGSGAVALLPLLDMALAVYDAASFDDLGMDAYEELS